MDSQLVIKQVKRQYTVNNEVLAPYFREATALIKYFKKLELEFTPREFNQQADALCKGKLIDFV